MLKSYRYFEIEATIKLYGPDRGRKSYIKSGYRPHIFFGYSDPNNPNFASDCIINLKDKDILNPGESSYVKIQILIFDHLKQLMDKGVKMKIKEGFRIVGEGEIVKVIGER